MDYRAWVRDPANFPGKYGKLFMRFVAARQSLHNVTDATVVWYVSSWKAYRDHVAQATTERDLRQHLYDGITAFGQRGVRPVTVNTATRCMQAFLNWLLEIEHIERPIKLPKLKVEERVLRVLSMEQIANLYHYVPKNMCQRRIHAITVLLLDTGIRTAEMLNLSPREVDFKTRTLRVMGKGRKERVVPFSQLAGEVLFKYLAERKVDCDYVFATEQGRKLDKRNVLRNIKQIGRRCGIPASAICLHRCRHSFATQYIAGGGQVVQLQKILGHSEIETTMQYVHPQMADTQRDHARHSPIGNLR
jgi:integrase/recombinase XerD